MMGNITYMSAEEWEALFGEPWDWSQSTFFANVPGQGEGGMLDPSWGGGGEMYSLGDIPFDISQEDIAQAIYDTLNPIYGEGGSLEVITVAVDPDRTIVDEYIEPAFEEYKEQILDPLAEYGENILFVAGLIALAVLVK